jgi:hypothetical protein
VTAEYEFNIDFPTGNLPLKGVTGEFERASNAQIAELEKKLNVKLPEDYLDFLQKFGPSLFTEDVVFTSIESSAWAVNGDECFDLFYGVSANAGCDLCNINVRLVGDIPSKAIAIGHDSGSNLILLKLDTDQVLFFDKETGKTFLIACGFNAFLKSFRRRELKK